MREERRPDILFLHGNGAEMREIEDGEADLVLTGPPYFTPQTEELLRKPRTQQTDPLTVRGQVVEFACSLRPVFCECARVLRPGGVVIIQTRDLRYGDFLLGPADVHRETLEGVGFLPVTDVAWLSRPRKDRRSPFLTKPVIGGFRTDDGERFCVFSRPEGVRRTNEKVAAAAGRPEALVDPVWRMPGAGGTRTHPHESPPSVIRRFIELFSRPGDLVVDPFAGHGTILRVCRQMGRRAVGYEIDRACFELGLRRLEGRREA